MQQLDLKSLSNLRIVGLVEKMTKLGYTSNAFVKMKIRSHDKSAYKYGLLSHVFNRINVETFFFRFFFMNQRVTIKEMSRFFSTNEIRDFIKSGIFVKVPHRSLCSSIAIIPFENYYFASDYYPYFFPQNIRNDYVLEENIVPPLAESTIDLWNTIVKKKVNTTLDLCSGCGCLAILFSSLSQRVFGVDINKRAILFSEFNLRLNRITNVTFIRGDLFSPVKKVFFDCIVANPPYQSAFFSDKFYRNGGKFGDNILKKIIKQAPLFLNRGGTCYIVSEYLDRKNYPIDKTVLRLPRDPCNISFKEKFYVSLPNYIYLSLINKTKSLDIYNKRSVSAIKYLNHVNALGVHYGVFIIKPSRKTSFSFISWDQHQ